MIELVLTHHDEDAAVANRLAAALGQKGFHCKPYPTGPDWRRQRAADLDSAAAVLVLWSEASVGGEGGLVQEEAERARKRGILLSVRIADVEIPLGFGSGPACDLLDWGGSAGSSAFKNIVEKIRRLTRTETQADSAEGSSRWKLILSAASTLLFILSFFSDLLGTQTLLCKVPGIHSVCAQHQWGGVPTPEEAESWSRIEPGNCDQVLAHRVRFPEGVYAEEAARRLAAVQTQSFETWIPRNQNLPLNLSAPIVPQPTEDAAREAAASAALAEARELCNYITQGGRHRLKDVALLDPDFGCNPFSGGFTCSIAAKAGCLLEELVIEERRVCF